MYVCLYVNAIPVHPDPGIHRTINGSLWTTIKEPTSTEVHRVCPEGAASHMARTGLGEQHEVLFHVKCNDDNAV